MTDFRDGSKDVFSRHLRPFWGCKQKIIFSPIFRKNRESYNGKDRLNIQIGITLFLYVQDIETLFACKVGFSGNSNMLSEFSREERELHI